MFGPKARTVDCAIIGALYRSTREMTAAEIGADTGVGSWAIHPALSRLEGSGVLMSHWEMEPQQPGAPRRRFYGLGRRFDPTSQLPHGNGQVERR